MTLTFIFHATIASNIFLSNFLNTVFFHEIFRSFRFSLKFAAEHQTEAVVGLRDVKLFDVSLVWNVKFSFKKKAQQSFFPLSHPPGGAGKTEALKATDRW